MYYDQMRTRDVFAAKNRILFEAIISVVIRHIGAALQNSSGHQMQFNIVFQKDSTAQILAGRHDNSTTPTRSACVNRFLNGSRIYSLPVVFRSEIINNIILLRLH